MAPRLARSALLSAIDMNVSDSASLNATSSGPIVPRGEHNFSAHAVQFYGEDGFLLDELSRFIGTSLGAGEGAVVIATKEHREGLARRLKAFGLDTSSAVLQGRYVALDAA